MLGRWYPRMSDAPKPSGTTAYTNGGPSAAEAQVKDPRAALVAPRLAAKGPAPQPHAAGPEGPVQRGQRRVDADRVTTPGAEAQRPAAAALDRADSDAGRHRARASATREGE